MNGYGSHTYLWENAGGEKFWVKYHFKTDQGIGYLTQAEADRIAGADADYYIRDLFTSIEAGNHPSWTLYVQVMPYADAADYRFNPFDLTKVWPHGDYPLIKVGRYVLDRNPANYFAADRAGRLRAGQPGAGHRPFAGQDAARQAVRLPGRAPLPDRRELHPAAGQRAEVPGEQLLEGRRDALQQPGRPGVRAELLRRPARRPAWQARPRPPTASRTR